MFCSPGREKSYASHKTCFSKAQLQAICVQLQIKTNKTDNKKAIWSAINDKMASKCKDERCWIQFVQIDASVSHKPQQPISWTNNPHNWLDSDDLKHVMTQYESKYKTFKFIGVLPIDFNSPRDIYSDVCVRDELCDINLSTMKQKQFGIIFNMDRHDQSGSHWVCAYVNLNPKNKNYGFNYFDSGARAIPEQINTFAKKVRLDEKQKGTIKNFCIRYSKTQKQFGKSECGMFCLYFLTQCLKGVSFSTIDKEAISDEHMYSLRNKMFMKRDYL